MKFLLDTHAVLWIAESSPRLSPKVRTLAGNAAERGLALGFGVEPTWFSCAMLARVLDDSASRK